MPVAPEFNNNFTPPPQNNDNSKKKNAILIAVIAALAVVLIAVIALFVIKPKLDEKKTTSPSEEETTVAEVVAGETTTKENETTTETEETTVIEVTTKRESITNKEKTSNKSESEKKDTNNKFDSGKNKDSDTAVDIPDIDDYEYEDDRLEEAYKELEWVLNTIEWGDSYDREMIFTDGKGLSGDADEQLAFDFLESTIPYFTYDIWAYDIIDDYTYDFYVDIYTVDAWSVAEAYTNEVLWYFENEYYINGNDPTDAEIEEAIEQCLFDSIYYYDHDSVYTSTYITMTYKDGEWYIDSVEDIMECMIYDFEYALESAVEDIYTGIEELDEYYNDYSYYSEDEEYYF